VPHSDFGEAVVAAVVRRETDVDLSMIKSLLAQKLAKYKQPKTIVFLPELPRNAMGKVQKNVLREDFLRVSLPRG
jgi:malonyl-CoA/methylmalonyl-CoA synthetase